MGHKASLPRTQYNISDEIKAFVSGETTRTSMRYRMLLHAARGVFDNMEGFDDIDMLCQYLTDLGPMKVKEVKRVATDIIERSQSEAEAKEKLIKVLTAARISMPPVWGRCLSPSLDRSLYLSVLKGVPSRFWDPQNPPLLFKFGDPEVIQARAAQLKEDRSDCCDPNHVRDALYVVLSNRVWTFWANGRDTPYVPRKTPRRRPTGPVHEWSPNLYLAFRDNNVMRAEYILWLVPELVNMPVSSTNTGTLLNVAAESCPPEMIQRLHELGADFNVPDGSGALPIHDANPENQRLLEKLGYPYNTFNEDGESCLHWGVGNKKVLQAILVHGEDLTKPNSKGTFWLPWAKRRFYRDDFRQVCQYIMQSTNPIYRDTHIREILESKNPLSEFKKAIEDGDVEMIKVYLAAGMDANSRMRNGEPILNYCIQKCTPEYNEIVRMLLANYASPHLINPQTPTPFWTACVNHNFVAAECLLSYNAVTEGPGVDGWTILQWSYDEKDYEVLAFCVEHVNVNCKDKDGLNLTFHAFANRDDAMAERLQDNGGDIQCQDKSGNSLAHLACFEGDHGRISYLISRKIDLELKNKKGRTVFMEAVNKKDLGLCEMLLHHGVDINTADSAGNTPLLLTEDTEMVKFLVEKGCDLNVLGANGRTKLMNFVATKEPEMCRFLVEHGADVDIPSAKHNGMTALHMALLETPVADMVPIIELFLSKAKDPDVRDGDDNTPSMLAASSCNEKICRLLVEQYAIKVNARDKNRDTAFLLACKSDVFNPAVFDYLLTTECFVNVHDSEHMWALSALIRKNRRAEAFRLLSHPKLDTKSIVSPRSEFEPILMALDNDDKEMVEKLVDMGANAANSERSVVIQYCRRAFFDMNIFKKMGEYNMVVDGPIPWLMHWNLSDIAKYLSSLAGSQTKCRISETQDCDGRTPVMLAILQKDYDFADVLLSKNYDLTTKDDWGMTPIMYCAKIPNLKWTRWVYGQIGPQKAGRLANNGSSVLTIAANNEWEKFCDEMFVDGIEMPTALDGNGIIRGYKEKLATYEKRLETARKRVKCYEEMIEWHRKERERKKVMIDRAASLYQTEWTKHTNRIEKLMPLLAQSREVFSHFSQATRSDILNNEDVLTRVYKRLPYQAGYW